MTRSEEEPNARGLTREEERGVRDLVIGDHVVTHTFWCAGCKSYHWIDKRWTVTTGGAGPTVRGSVRVRIRDDQLCHLFIADGNVRYLGDCTHGLKGQTVPLEEFEQHGGQ